jgi:aerobic-type carbon monoxide dehydrogenase small subunit (CoxS/CutS family)
VLVDGKPMSGCLLLAEQAVGKQLTTVEGLPAGDSLHRVQQAFIDHRAFQCAYCTPGFLLGAVALLDENPAPTDGEIVEALSASLCRCGSYGNILSAVRSLRSS